MNKPIKMIVMGFWVFFFLRKLNPSVILIAGRWRLEEKHRALSKSWKRTLLFHSKFKNKIYLEPEAK